MTGPVTGKRVLVVATDAVVLDEVLRLAAVANCETECVPDLFAARARWKDAPLVLIDEAAVTEDEPVKLPRRDGVLVVCKGPPEPGTWQRAFAVGAQQVHSLPDDETAVLKAFAEIVDGPARPGGRVLAVIGGRGGAGASVFAAGLATAAARAGEGTLLLDCDPLGGGLDLLLGAENHRAVRWPDLRVDSGRILLSALEEALPHHDCSPGRFAFLSTGTPPRTGAPSHPLSRDRSTTFAAPNPPPHASEPFTAEPNSARRRTTPPTDRPSPNGEAIAAVVDAARRAGRFVICDLPRNLGDGSAEAAARADLVLMVVPLDFRACSAAKRVVALLRGTGAEIRLVAKGPARSGLSATQAADTLDVPLLGEYRHEPRLTRSLTRGSFHPGGSLLSVAASAIAALPRQEPTP
ncbi:septum site-determining protein Ssd [Amycolatopsis sp. YIM 10]|uniref:septum site-determining protein Ssd n=1 Tax=Amycolatopsis sp. YIM 10 TaxID=2653857 RepID=UPI001290390C|nr:septum site-determining protein Ssd [Amycolatopsis sp. YIM 10]QFU85696.1 CobQ/CobB/MinD/ParA nucleotide binding domain protein [Amycolatopsis sp. YIM 10]